MPYIRSAGYENLQFFTKVYQIPKQLQKERIDEALELVGLVEKAQEKVENYSGGMKRRLNIACAILHNPKLLIMDEPTVGIDPQSRNHILEMVKQLNQRGMTILYTSHYMEEVEFLCNRIAIMDYGSIIAEGEKEALVHMLQHQDFVTIKLDYHNEAFTQALENLQDIEAEVFSREIFRCTGGRN